MTAHPPINDPKRDPVSARPDPSAIEIEGTLTAAEHQELIARSAQLFGEPDAPGSSKVLPVVLAVGLAAALILFAVQREAAAAVAIVAALVGLIAGYALGLRRVGAVGTPIVGWSFRPDGARDRYESGGYLFHPWAVLTVVHADWGILGVADRKPMVFVPARLLHGADRATAILALAEAGGATVKAAS